MSEAFLRKVSACNGVQVLIEELIRSEDAKFRKKNLPDEQKKHVTTAGQKNSSAQSDSPAVGE
jgi:hypothetical protein